MAQIMRQYGATVFDGSIYFDNLSDSVFQDYPSEGYYAAPTFLSEFNQFKEIIHPAERETLYKNYLILQEKKLRILDLGSDTMGDTWSLLCRLEKDNTEEEKKVLYVTANFGMIRRVILSGLPVDIYDLSQKEWIPSEMQNSRRRELEYPPASAEKVQGYIPESKFELYTDNGDLVQLHKSRVGSGSEAELYRCRAYPKWVAKIFHTPPTMDKQSNVRAMQQLGKNFDLIWTTYPRKILYWDPEKKFMAGYFQDYLSKKNFITISDPYFRNGINDSPPLEDETFCPNDTLEWCIRICRQIALLNHHDVFVCDYNLDNFAVDRSVEDNGKWRKSKLVYMWDTDSFCTPVYRPSHGAPDLHTRKDYNNDSSLDAIEKCTELLYSRIFKMLSLGRMPIHMNTGANEMEKILEFGGLHVDLVPEPVMDLVKKVFLSDGIPSVDALLHALTVAKEKCQEKWFNDRPYLEIKAVYDAREQAQKEREQEPLNTYLDPVLCPQSPQPMEPTTFSAMKCFRGLEGDISDSVIMTVDTPKMYLRYPNVTAISLQLFAQDQDVLHRKQKYLKDREERKEHRKKRRQDLKVILRILLILLLFLTVFGLLIYMFHEIVGEIFSDIGGFLRENLLLK